MARRRRNHSRSELRGRRLRVEALEDRRMLAVFTVSNLDDAGSGSLRDAIIQANSAGGADTIEFAADLSGETISLSTGEMVITGALSIDARPLEANVTINANLASRIFNITATSGDFTLGGLTLTGGKTTATGSNGRGGAIRSLTTGNLTLDQSTVSGNSTVGKNARGGGISTEGAVTLTQSTVSGNSTAGENAHGGGICAAGTTLTWSTISGNSTGGTHAYGGGICAGGTLKLTQSTVSENSTSGDGAHGGGIFAYDAATLTQSTVSGNSTSGNSAKGGGIFSYNAFAYSSHAVTLTQSTVSGNSTSGYVAHGGGIWAFDDVTLTQSTVSGNSTTGVFARGGGIVAKDTVTLTQSTVSGNSTSGNGADGGGIVAYKAVTLTQSTVTDNHAMNVLGDAANGGGVYQTNSVSNHAFSISGSIVAGNTAGGGGPDLVKDPQSTLTVNYSLIGVPDGLTFAGNVGNLTGTAAISLAPQLGPLANNGGPTETHALLAGSPAIDAGDPSFMGPPNFDQRGFAYSRVIGGRIDIGAIEFAVSADFDEDGDVDGLDFLAWQLGFGIAAPNAAKSDGDADNDTDVDGDDLAVWETDYETVGPFSALSSEFLAVQQTEAALSPRLVDLAIVSDRTDADSGADSAEFLAEEIAPEVFRRAIAQFNDAPRLVAGDFGDIATSRTAVDDSRATQLEDELVAAQI